MSEPLGAARRAAAIYRTEAGELPVLRGVDLTLHAGEIVALVAPSGAGKSTLLHIAGLLEKPDGGAVLDRGQRRRRRWPMPRARRSGATPSASSISSIICCREFSALENVMLPQMIAGQAAQGGGRRALALLGVVRPRAARGAPARQALRRRAAARGDRARAGQRAGGAAGRRAHRQSRRRDATVVFENCWRLVRAREPRRADRDPQSRACRAHGPHGHAGRRQARAEPDRQR